MKNYRNLIVILTVLAALAAAAIACNMPAISSNPAEESSKQPGEIATQPALPEAGAVTITLTEGQLNTLIQQAMQGQVSQTIQDLQVRLEAGQVVITGTVNQNGLSLPLTLNLAINPDGQGGLTYRVSSASVGPLPLPESMRDQIETMLNQNLQAQVRQLTGNIYIDSINIGSGVMTVTGRPQ